MKPTTFAPMAISHSGCRTRSSSSRGDSGSLVLTFLVLRWSMAAESPSTPAATRAVTMATGVLLVKGLASPTPAERYASSFAGGANWNLMPCSRSVDRSHSTETAIPAPMSTIVVTSQIGT
jgi:hypothetical protein